MAFKLTKQQLYDRVALCAQIESATEALNVAIVDYNEAISIAKVWAEGIAADLDKAYADRSDRWREGDTGQAARAWVDTYKGFDWPDEMDSVDNISEDLLEKLTGWTATAADCRWWLARNPPPQD